MQETYHVVMDEKSIEQARVFLANNPQWTDHSLRLYIAGKGCDGFNYGVSFDTSKEDDARLPQVAADGWSVDLLVDPDTLKFVQGSQITWVDDERGKGFLVENPNHRKFRGKFYKRKDWEQRIPGYSQPKTESTQE